MSATSEQRESELRRARSATFWKMIAGASATIALSVVLYTSLHDGRPTRDEAVDPGARSAGLASNTSDDEDVDAAVAAEESAGAAPAEQHSTTTTTSATDTDLGDGGDGGAILRGLAAPTVAPTAPPVSDALAAQDAGDAGPPEEAPAAATRTPDAGEAGAPNPFAPPTMSAGAGPFITEAPYFASSAFQSNPNAGAGRFMTEAPPWSASAFVSNPEAGAGPFTTERNIPAFGAWP